MGYNLHNFMTNTQTIENLSPRQAVVLSRVLVSGFVTIEALAEEFGVSAQTVRRDIITLAEKGLLQRFHGGAGPVGPAEAARLDHAAKREVAKPEKQLVGARAAASIPDGASVFLDVGTTIECCAARLAQRVGFRIFTTSIRTALLFDPEANEVNVIGGRLSGKDGSLTGEEVILRLCDLQIDVALIACSAVDDADRVMDFNTSKIAVKKAAMNAASASYLLCTTSKFGRTALSTIAPISRFQSVITEVETS
ncbi:DeoR/GlpR family DNA-binding transcription regulator [Celeribacter halophilus]|jgi:DeoR family glycerol-3-phosphate regulon repressor|uniref:DeoR/GlpR family DNA-binding transcription regulator n=1 Tax=Celeribacter halophilus TaxID=576117 RepID=A0AAW7XZC3_9RHOB|nr:DeoR/GlpR family DNA-binding transcription regulator [Celeribacter halophilus]MDO6459031.1 DeoR/GlpR family DNA-binding transcription regulator [Celeribacter halophilus]